MAYGPALRFPRHRREARTNTHLPHRHAIEEPLERDATRARTPREAPRTQAYNLVKAGLLEKPLEFGFVMGAPNAQECDLGVLKCCGAFALLM